METKIFSQFLDTAGLLIDQTTDGHFQAKVEEKIKSLFSEVDLILFMVDGKSGIHAMDFEINKMLLPFKDKTMLIVNKLDSIETLSDVNDFFELGYGLPLGISSLNNLGVHDLLDVITSTVKTVSVSNEEVSKNIAIVGRPNVGKSSLINALVNDDRVIVDDLAGTTRMQLMCFLPIIKRNISLLIRLGLVKNRKRLSMSTFMRLFVQIRNSQV